MVSADDLLLAVMVQPFSGAAVVRRWHIFSANRLAVVVGIEPHLPEQQCRWPVRAVPARQSPHHAAQLPAGFRLSVDSWRGCCSSSRRPVPGGSLLPEKNLLPPAGTPAARQRIRCSSSVCATAAGSSWALFRIGKSCPGLLRQNGERRPPPTGCVRRPGCRRDRCPGACPGRRI